MECERNFVVTRSGHTKGPQNPIAARVRICDAENNGVVEKHFDVTALITDCRDSSGNLQAFTGYVSEGLAQCEIGIDLTANNVRSSVLAARI